MSRRARKALSAGDSRFLVHPVDAGWTMPSRCRYGSKLRSTSRASCWTKRKEPASFPRLVQIPAIRGPILYRDDDGPKPCAHELQVQDEPGVHAVSVPERIRVVKQAASGCAVGRDPSPPFLEGDDGQDAESRQDRHHPGTGIQSHGAEEALQGRQVHEAEMEQ